MLRKFWSVPREWERETVFIIGGGPSVAEQNLERLRGRRVIAINSSCYAVPWADMLYFGDARWWFDHREAVAKFAGRVVTVSTNVPDEKVKVCRLRRPPGLARDREMLSQRTTSFTAATNLAAHLTGPGGTIIWLGADGKPAKDGREWHHKPHRWRSKPGKYERQRDELATIVSCLKDMGIAAFNASPGSALKVLPPIRLEEAVALADGQRMAA